jgi:hypothetical protein
MAERARSEITSVTKRETARLILVFRLKAGINVHINDGWGGRDREVAET